jgi:phosphoribosylamine--glycine ligase
MGAFAPSPLVTPELQARLEREIVGPVLEGMVEEGTPFRGFLYCGLMIAADGPKVIEFNVRFGDPEAQVVLPLMDRPLGALLFAAADGAPSGVESPFDSTGRPAGVAQGGRESGPEVARSPRVAVGVVLAAHGYPGEVRSGDVIHGLDTLERECPDVLVFCAGVKDKDGALVTAGGRVLTIVARADTYAGAIERAYDAVSRVSFPGMQFRRDIGRKAL